MNAELHVDDLIPGFALGILEDTEMLQVARHVASCVLCRDELGRYARLVDGLAEAAPEAMPPEGLWERVAARVEDGPAAEAARPRRRPFLEALLRALFPRGYRPLGAWAVVSLVLVAALSVSTITLWRAQAGAPHRAAALPTFELFGTRAAPGGKGLMVASADGTEGTLVVDDLAPLGEGHRYQLWLMGPGSPATGALFTVGEEGYATVIVHAPRPLTAYSAFSVTVEPASGSAAPTGTAVLATRSFSE